MKRGWVAEEEFFEMMVIFEWVEWNPGGVWCDGKLT